MAQSFNAGSVFATLRLDDNAFVRSLNSARLLLQRFGDTARNAFSGAARAAQRFARASRTVFNAVRSVSRGIFNLRNLLGGLVAAFAGRKFSQVAADIENAERSFGRLFETVGENPERAFSALRRATRGTIDDLQLLQAANNALLLGVTESADGLAELAEISRRLGQVTGRTTLQAFQDLSIGIGRRSRRILDNIGIIVNINDANNRYAESLGTTADKLTAAQRQQAFFNEALRGAKDRIARVGPDVLTLGQLIGRFEANIANVVVQLTRNLNPALRELFLQLGSVPFDDFTRNLSGVFGPLFESSAQFFKENGKDILEFLTDVARLLATIVQYARRRLGQALDFFRELRELSAGERLGRVLTNFIDGIVRSVTGVAILVIEGIVSVFTNPELRARIIQFFVDLGGEILAGIGKTFGGVVERILSRFGGGDTPSEAGDRIDGLVSGLRALREEYLRFEPIENVAPNFDISRRADEANKALESLTKNVGVTGRELAKNIPKIYELEEALRALGAGPARTFGPGILSTIEGIKQAITEAKRLIEFDNGIAEFIAQFDKKSGPPRPGGAFDRFFPDPFEITRRIEAQRREEERQLRQSQQLARSFSNDLGFSVVEALRNGESAMVALADVFERQMEQAFGRLLDALGDQLGVLLKNLIGGGAGLSSVLGGIAGIGAAIGLATLSRNQSSGSTVTELPIEEIATSQAAVRGVVAGPTSVALGSVGSGIREANRGVESLLSSILAVLTEIRNEGTLGAGGVGATGVI